MYSNINFNTHILFVLYEWFILTEHSVKDSELKFNKLKISKVELNIHTDSWYHFV